tara:strand:+ start:170 stop:394 length:225 start_codon:yes stop_codon:yes gene_type:complete
MFRNTQKIKDLEKQVEDLKYLCTQLTNNIIRLMQEQSVVTETVKSLLENQKVINRLISTKHGIAVANDDDDFIH